MEIKFCTLLRINKQPSENYSEVQMPQNSCTRNGTCFLQGIYQNSKHFCHCYFGFSSEMCVFPSHERLPLWLMPCLTAPSAGEGQRPWMAQDGWSKLEVPGWKFLADSPSWMVQCGCSWLDGLGWMIPAVWSRLDSPSWMITTGWSGLNALSWMNPAGWSHWMEDVGWAWLEQVVPAWSSSVLVSAGVLLLPCQYTVLSFRFRLRMVLITCWCFGFLLNHVYPKQGLFSSCLMLFQQGGRQKNKLGGSTARPGDLS